MNAAPCNQPLNPSTSDTCCCVVLLSLGDCAVAVLEVGGLEPLVLSFSYEQWGRRVAALCNQSSAFYIGSVALYGGLQGLCGSWGIRVFISYL